MTLAANTSANRDRTAQKAAYRAANRERIREYQKAYRAANPEKRKQESARYYEKNAELMREKSRIWMVENPEKYADSLARKRKQKIALTPEQDASKRADRLARRREARAKYRAKSLDAHRRYEHTRRAIKRSSGGVLPKDIVQVKMREQDGSCVYCGAELLDTGNHIDHRMPLALGGSNTVDNVQLLCPHCNWSKGARHPDEFEKMIGFTKRSGA